MGYRSAEEFDRALKRAVRRVGGDPGEAYRQALRDRFLCRVFTKDLGRFVLKGGSGLAGVFFDPALGDADADAEWDPSLRAWSQRW